MAITYPYDLLASFPGWSTSFELLWRQEQSRQTNGKTQVKDLGDPLWQATYQSRSMRANELDSWRARLDLMENGAGTFYGRHFARCRPIKHPGSSTLPTGTLASITDNKVVGVTGLTGITLSVGDMLQIGDTDLHRIADISGSAYEVRPHIWPGVTTGATVTISKPHCIMAIVPGSISTTADPQTGDGTVSFQAMEARG